MECVLQELRQQLGYQMVRHGLNYSELARRSGVRPSFIYDILNGKSLNPSVVKLCKVAQALNVPLTDLLGGEGEQFSVSAQRQRDFVSVPWFLRSDDKQNPLLSFRRTWLEMAGGIGDIHALSLYRMHDVSMRPVLECHDVVLLDMAIDWERVAGLYLVKCYDSYMVRRVELCDIAGVRSVRLVPCHSEYGVLEVPCHEVVLQGRVVWRGSFTIE